MDSHNDYNPDPRVLSDIVYGLFIDLKLCQRGACATIRCEFDEQ